LRPSHADELQALAARLLTELDDYETRLNALLGQPQDEVLYARNAAQFDCIRACATTLPGLQVCWVEVLISRFELLDELWRKPEQSAPGTKLPAVRTKHGETLGTLRRLCLRRYPDACPGAAAPDR
jgi:hypothetical protein